MLWRRREALVRIKIQARGTKFLHLPCAKGKENMLTLVMYEQNWGPGMYVWYRRNKHWKASGGNKFLASTKRLPSSAELCRSSSSTCAFSPTVCFQNSSLAISKVKFSCTTYTCINSLVLDYSLLLPPMESYYIFLLYFLPSKPTNASIPSSYFQAQYVPRYY